ncbi:hypothetical protein [Endozoicomonas sp. SCSIO W0465]|uniref:hypothetical protein n=1 Tax=Endozoicomonas sp. SCSIO W0465 TaxID=2918516 RepID=UPI0020766358|nr:hypothetical protein [Endozoicomonas sp. SCSIO W0465]USE36163.1 hypothetical protein MJO57_29665 [Endozoicomonas sp. SCSIO W0465]
MESIKPVFAQQALTVQDLGRDMVSLDSMDSIDNPLGYHDSSLVQIEMYSRMICYGFNNPFPHSRQHLAFALIGIKYLLNQVSLAELIMGSSDIKETPIKQGRPDIQHMEKLDKLLDCPMIVGSLPTLREALRFVHKKDQQEIYNILKRKLKR